MIPGKIQLMGVPVTIEIGNARAWRKQSLEARYGGDRLVIDEQIASRHLREISFVRELITQILYTMGENELLNNRHSLNLFSRMMHQALQGIIQSEIAQHGNQMPPDAEHDECYWAYLLANAGALSDKNDGELLDTWDIEGLDEYLFDHEEPDDDYEYDCMRDHASEEADRYEDYGAEVVKSFWDEYFEPDERDSASWTDYADRYERSNDRGWYYEDDD